MSESQELKYPITMVLKAIMLSDKDENRNIDDLNSILNDLSIPLRETWKVNSSSSDKYRSYSGLVYIENREKMYALYAALKACPRVKFAI